MSQPQPTITYYHSEIDGERVIHIDTPETWEENEQGPCCRIYLNDDTENPLFSNPARVLKHSLNG